MEGGLEDSILGMKSWEVIDKENSQMLKSIPIPVFYVSSGSLICFSSSFCAS